MALAPAANLAHVEVKGIHKLATFWREMQLAVLEMGAYDMFNANWLEEQVLQSLCGEFDNFCADVVKDFADMNPDVDNMDRMEVFLKDYPAGAGYRNLVHYAQDIHNDGFNRFNFGERANLVKYGYVEPPAYPLEDFNIPTALVAGTLDRLADPTDVAWLNQ